MITKPLTLTALTITAFLFAASCTKKGSTGATGPAGPAYTGTITGHVNVYDQYGSKMFNGLGNIQVTLKGIGTVSTDATGYYYFSNVPTGTYQISASGSGLASTIQNNVPFLKDTLYNDIKISLQPVFNISSFTAYHNTGSVYDSLVITAGIDSRVRSCIVFVNKNGPAGNTPGHYLLTYTKSFTTTGWNTSTLVIRVPASDLNYAGIFYGDKVYYTAASYVVNDASVYEDETTGQMVYNAIGTPLIDSTTCP